MAQAESVKYGRVAQALHWLTAITVLVAFIYGLGGPEHRVYASSRDFDRQLHETLGMCVLVLTLFRLVWRIYDAPPAPEKMSPILHRVSQTVQVLLYVLLFAVPLTAIVGAWLEGHPVAFIGGFQILPLVAPQHAMGVTVSEIHTWLGDAIMWLAGFHAMAALFHHFYLKDRVLMAMLPGKPL